MAKVVVVLAPGFEELEAVALIDVMRRGGIEVTLAYTNTKEVLGANAIRLVADCPIESIEADQFDMIVLPGGWDGTYTMAENEHLRTLLKHFAEGSMIAAICAAPYVLNKAGVLKGNYTCYPAAADEIDCEGYTEEMAVVKSDNIITSRGPGTAVCLGLEIVKALVDGETAAAIKEGMLLEYC